MTHPYEPDLGPLNWVKDEIERSLTRASEAIDKAQSEEGARPRHLQFAQTHLHQARGAMSIVGLNGLAHFADVLDGFWGRCAREERPFEPDGAAVSQRALSAIKNYIEEVCDGAPDQALRLARLYTELCRIDGRAGSPVDLFFPPTDLSRRPDPSATGLKAEALKPLRTLFDQGLLLWLKQGEKGPGPERMRQAIAGLEAAQTQALAKAFWWVALGFMEGLMRRELTNTPEVKRLCTRIAGFVRKPEEMGKRPPERLLRELLFQLALAPSTSPVIREIKDTYGLEGLIPAQGQQISEILMAPIIKILKEQLIGLRESWIAFGEGSASALVDFERRLKPLIHAAKPLGRPATDRLLGALAVFCHWIRKDPLRADEVVKLEVATALLLAENLLSAAGGKGNIATQVTETLTRLDAIMRGSVPPVAPPPATASAARKAQERDALEQLRREILSNLSHVEQVLDSVFRHPERKNDLPTVALPLLQVEGALKVLGEGRASDEVAKARADIETLGALSEPSTALCEQIANRLSALSLYIDAFRGSTLDLDALLTPSKGLKAAMAPPSARVESDFLSEEGSAPPEPPVAPAASPPFDEKPSKPTRSGLQTPVSDITPPPTRAGGSKPKDEAPPVLEVGAEAPAAETRPAMASPAPGFEALAPADTTPAPDAGHLPEMAAAQPRLAPQAPPSVIADAAGPAPRLDDAALAEKKAEKAALDAELLGIFIEEAIDVLTQIGQGLEKSLANPANTEALTLIRRAFHTLKGSGRMVGLVDLGEAAWELEQTLNRWLQMEWPPSEALYVLIDRAHGFFSAWVSALQKGDNTCFWDEVLFEMARHLRERDTPDEASRAAMAVCLSGAVEGPATLMMATQATAASPEDTEHENVEGAEGPEGAEGAEGDSPPPPLAHAPSTDPVALAGEAAGADEDTLPLLDLEEEPFLECIDLEGLESLEALTALPALEAFDFEMTQHTPAVAKEGEEGRIAEDRPAEPAPTHEPPEQPAKPAPTHEPPEQPAKPTPAEDPGMVTRGEWSIPKALFDLFMGEAHQHLDTLTASLHHLRLNPTLFPEKAAIRAAHTLAGISGATRVAALQPLAKSHELALERFHDAQVAPRADEMDVLVAGAQRMQAMLAEMIQGLMPLPSPELTAQLDALGHGLQIAPLLAEPLPDVPPPEQPQDSHAPATLWDGIPEGIKDDIDPQILPIFLEEGEEHFSRLGEALRQWRKNPEEEDAPKAIARLLHTLKGNARMAGAMILGQGFHTLESMLEAELKAGTPVPTLLDVLENGLDAASQRFRWLSDPDAFTLADQADTPKAPSSSEALPSLTGEEGDKPSDSTASLRVRAELVDRFVNEAGEIGIARARLDGEMRTIRRSLLDLTENVIRLRNQLRELEIQAETQIHAQTVSAPSAHEGFDPLEMDRYTRLQELTRMMAESVSDVTTVQQNLLRNLDNADAALTTQGRLTRELQQALMSVRMVPFDSLAERLYRITRQSARELGKRAQLDIRGGRIEMDRSILERMTAPLEHLLRNALAHGLEEAAEREAAGKPDMGRITVSVTQEGNEILIELADDGRGLNFERIAEKARGAGFLGENEQADENQLASFIFLPGFSTAGEVSSLSGRGVGMDVVKTAASEVGGRIEIQSLTGQGTRFRLFLPLTLAMTQALLVRVGARTFAIPSSMIAQVMELKPDPLKRLMEEEALAWQGHTYAYRYLPRLLGDDKASPDIQRYNWVLLLRSASQHIALHVDGLRGNQEIVVKKAGPQLTRVVGITGATVLGEGEVALIINPVALASRAFIDIRTGPRLPDVFAADRPPPASPLVMVVDDSLTVRKITTRFLEREGFRVLTAKDGVDGIEKLLEAMPDVILSDIEMPRMDGFDFLRNLRADPALTHIPVVMITSRLAEKHRAYAKELGANHYLGKPYQEEELLALLRQYCPVKTNP